MFLDEARVKRLIHLVGKGLGECEQSCRARYGAKPFFGSIINAYIVLA
jgi:hypothetical protein